MYDAIEHGDASAVAAIAPPLLKLACAIIVDAANEPSRLQRVGPWIAADTFELCGYAMTYDRLSKADAGTWPLLRDAMEAAILQSTVALRGYAELASIGANILQCPHRSLQRQEWQIRLNEHLRQHGILGYRNGMERFGDDGESSGDMLLDALVSTSEPRFDSLTVFYALYLLDAHPEALPTPDDDTERLHELMLQQNGLADS